jgi:hypothetical protein
VEVIHRWTATRFLLQNRKIVKYRVDDNKDEERNVP